MKHFFLFAALLAWLGGALHAQTPNKSFVLDNITRSLLEQLDKSEVQTGILLEQAPLFVSPFKYDGVLMNDSNTMDASQFGKLFGQFRAATLDNTPILPDPSIYLNDLKRLREHPDTIPLALMAMQYNYIWPGAFDAGQIRWDSNQKLVDIPGRDASPYHLDTTFAFAALIQQSSNKHVVFQIPSKLIFNNLGWNIDRLQLNIGDGKGWQDIVPGACINANYTTPGKKELILRIRQNGKYWQAHSSVIIPEITISERYEDTPDEELTLGGAILNIFFDCEDHKLRKPLIVVEGFGGERTDYRLLLNLIDKKSSNGVTLRSFLDSEGYDLIWIDWINSNASIQSNAASLQSAIEYINARKHADGSGEPTNMLASSMGGLVAKYCLLSMHNTQGVDSEIEHLFTYDSPLTGANFPVGIQLFIRDLLSLSSSSASDPFLIGALSLLDGAAATQMLRQKVVVDANGNMSLSSAGLDALLAEMGAMEAVNPLSAITRHIALSNGSALVQENMLDPIAVNLNLNIQHNPVAAILIDITGYVAGATNSLLYTRFIYLDPVGWEPPFLVSTFAYNHSAPLGLDVAPGGINNVGLDIIDNALLSAIPSTPNLNSWSRDVKMKKYCFVPTVSSMGQPTSVPLINGDPVAGSSASRTSISTDNSETYEFTNLPEFNQQHVSMNVRIADVLVDELKAPPLSISPRNGFIRFSNI